MIQKKPLSLGSFRRMIFLDKARTAFKQILNEVGPNNKILLPAYIGINDKEGSGVFDPIMETKTDYEFYRIKKDLSIDMIDFNEKIKDSNVNLVLVIHYFGFVQSDMRLIATICKTHGKYLIEDCAHSLFSEYKDKKVGTFGDASFFSLHKSLPMKGGGILQINNKNIGDFNIANTVHINTYVGFDFKKIIECRRKNYLYLLDKLKNFLNIEIIYPELPEGIVPLNFPILIKNINRDKVYFKMQERGVELVSLYYRIIEQINENFLDSHYLSKHITNLPIHQDVNYLDINKMVEDLKFVLEELESNE